MKKGPWTVTCTGDGIEVYGTIETARELDRLIRALTVYREFLPELLDEAALRESPDA